jgi:hypothetical protein
MFDALPARGTVSMTLVPSVRFGAIPKARP